MGIAGIVPRLRWTVTAMYAVLTSVLQEEDREEERAKTDVETHVQSMDFLRSSVWAQLCLG